MVDIDISKFSDDNEVAPDIFEVNGEYIIYAKHKVYGIFNDLKLARQVRGALKFQDWRINIFLRTDLEFKGRLCKFGLDEDKIIRLKGFTDKKPEKKVVAPRKKKSKVNKRKSISRHKSKTIPSRDIKFKKQNPKSSQDKTKEILPNSTKKEEKFKAVPSRRYQKVLEENIQKVRKRLRGRDISRVLFEDYVKKINDKVFYLYEYYPTHQYGELENSKDFRISQDIIDYKKWATTNSLLKKRAFITFTQYLKNAVIFISKCLDQEVRLISVPSSFKGSVNSISKSISTIANKKDILDYSHVLVRHTSVTPSRSSGRRNTAEDHYNSIKCNEKLNKDHVYILMDDVFTKGVTWNACKNILIKNGASEDNIWGLVVGKTTYADESCGEEVEFVVDIYSYCRDLMLDGDEDYIKKAAKKFNIQEKTILKLFEKFRLYGLLEEAKEQLSQLK